MTPFFRVNPTGLIPGMCSRRLSRPVLSLVLLFGVVWAMQNARAAGQEAAPTEPSARPWLHIIEQAGGLGLPTAFLERIPPDFVTITFADLRSFAAEYHPGDHVMVLNRSLSLNAAGGALRPLSRLTHRELATLYHELFHAYLDFVITGSERLGEDAPSGRLLAFARQQAACRYRQVHITPVRQRKTHTEMRFLTDGEAWEALNETWAVLVEWAIWTTLQVREEAAGAGEERAVRFTEEWLRLLKAADRKGQLVGFYEPADPQERAIANKRYLAPTHRITPPEAALLLEIVLDKPPGFARRAAGLMEAPKPAGPALPGCETGGGG